MIIIKRGGGMPLTVMTKPRIQIERGIPLYTGTREDDTTSSYELSVCIDDIPNTTNPTKIVELDLIDDAKCMVLEFTGAATGDDSAFDTVLASYSVTYNKPTVTQTALNELHSAPAKNINCTVTYVSDNKVGIFVSKSDVVTAKRRATIKIKITVSGGNTGSFNSKLIKIY